MPEAIISASGAQHGLVINSSGAAMVDNSSPTIEIIRLNAGSPATDFVFNTISKGVSILNIGSAPVYYKFDAIADTGSTSGFLSQGCAFEADLKCGSVSVLGSGTSTSEVEVIKLS